MKTEQGEEERDSILIAPSLFLPGSKKDLKFLLSFPNLKNTLSLPCESIILGEKKKKGKKKRLWEEREEGHQWRRWLWGGRGMF